LNAGAAGTVWVGTWPGGRAAGLVHRRIFQVAQGVADLLLFRVAVLKGLVRGRRVAPVGRYLLVDGGAFLQQGLVLRVGSRQFALDAPLEQSSHGQFRRGSRGRIGSIG
jgi:hypothetical protein